MHRSKGFIEFVERKPLLFDDIQALLRPAIESNQHTNFGPVATSLEREIAEINKLRSDRSACCTTNATLAIQGVVATFDNYFGQKLRWLVSDFGFFTNFSGAFSTQKSVSCDHTGIVSLAKLNEIPSSEYDAIMATNVFGLHENFDDLIEFCRRQGKVLLIDNAAGFTALSEFNSSPESSDFMWAEVVSFHHTKPWGMGEGGAVFLPKELEHIFKAAINFGVGGGSLLEDLTYCSNGKMSEVAAAQILSRIHKRGDWIQSYRTQAERILVLGKKAGLKPLIKLLPQNAVPGQVAFLSNEPCGLEQLANPFFQILKYYRPSRQSGPIAREIFDHILNVPCHSGMDAVSDSTIMAVLEKFGG